MYRTVDDIQAEQEKYPMTQLFITKHDREIGNKKVTPGVMVLGSHPSCDLALECGTVSARHARIATYFGLSYIQDMESRTGTYVNGKPVHMQVLRSGDVVRIGSHYMRVECAEPVYHADTEKMDCAHSAPETNRPDGRQGRRARVSSATM